MKKIIYILLFVSVLFSCGSKKNDPGEIVGKTAKIYYDYLLNGNYDAFVAGMNQPERIPDNYREQLVAIARSNHTENYLGGQYSDSRAPAYCGGQ